MQDFLRIFPLRVLDENLWGSFSGVFRTNPPSKFWTQTLGRESSLEVGNQNPLWEVLGANPWGPSLGGPARWGGSNLCAVGRRLPFSGEGAITSTHLTHLHKREDARTSINCRLPATARVFLSPPFGVPECDGSFGVSALRGLRPSGGACSLWGPVPPFRSWFGSTDIPPPIS